jgi:Ca2+-binding EF-hand superfamily protein
MREFGLVRVETDDDMDILLDTIDKDKDGMISFQDFVANFPMFDYN